MDPLPLATVDHQPGLAQQGHVTGDFRLRLGGRGAEIADAQFTCLTEQHDDGEPRFVGEGFEELEWVEHGSSCCGIIHIRLIISVLMAREKVRFEEGECQLTKKPFMLTSQ